MSSKHTYEELAERYVEFQKRRAGLLILLLLLISSLPRLRLLSDRYYMFITLNLGGSSGLASRVDLTKQDLVLG